MSRSSSPLAQNKNYYRRGIYSTGKLRNLKRFIEEELGEWPYNPEAPQRIHDMGVDLKYYQELLENAYIFVEEREYETGPWSNIDTEASSKTAPIYSYRLKEDVARKHGLIATWTAGWSAQGEAPGTMAFYQPYNISSSVWKKPYIRLQR